MISMRPAAGYAVAYRASPVEAPIPGGRCPPKTEFRRSRPADRVEHDYRSQTAHESCGTGWRLRRRACPHSGAAVSTCHRDCRIIGPHCRKLDDVCHVAGSRRYWRRYQRRSIHAAAHTVMPPVMLARQNLSPSGSRCALTQSPAVTPSMIDACRCRDGEKRVGIGTATGIWRCCRRSDHARRQVWFGEFSRLDRYVGRVRCRVMPGTTQ